VNGVDGQEVSAELDKSFSCLLSLNLLDGIVQLLLPILRHL